jgi:hypothetical protein
MHPLEAYLEPCQALLCRLIDATWVPPFALLHCVNWWHPSKGRFFFTPTKMGAQTGEANINVGVAAANQIVNLFENGNVTFKVN